MAHGIRIRHNARRNCMLPVPLLHRPLLNAPAYPDCGACLRASGKQIKHLTKTYHLTLDETGSVIVSETIWRELQRTAKNGGFTFESIVKDPPMQYAKPPHVKLKVHGVDLTGIAKPKRKQHSTGSGRMTRTDDAPKDHQVSLDRYLDEAEKVGIDNDAAINLLMVAFLRGQLVGTTSLEPVKEKI